MSIYIFRGFVHTHRYSYFSFYYRDLVARERSRTTNILIIEYNALTFSPVLTHLTNFLFPQNSGAMYFNVILHIRYVIFKLSIESVLWIRILVEIIIALRLWHTQRQFAAFLTSQIRRDIALDSFQCYFNGPIHTCRVFRCKCTTIFLQCDFFALDPFLLHDFLCDFVLQLV